MLLFFDNYPQDQIPRLGSRGEKWREKALMFQMPKQDISQEHCHFLKNEDSVKNYQKFIEERNHNALDIGISLINSDDPDLVIICVTSLVSRVLLSIRTLFLALQSLQSIY